MNLSSEPELGPGKTIPRAICFKSSGMRHGFAVVTASEYRGFTERTVIARVTDHGKALSEPPPC